MNIHNQSASNSNIRNNTNIGNYTNININTNNTNNFNNSNNKQTINPTNNFAFNVSATPSSSFAPSYSPASPRSTVTFAPSLPSTASFPKYNQLTTDMFSKNNFDEYNKKAAAVFFAPSQDQESLFGDPDRTARKNKSHSNTGKKSRGGPARISWFVLLQLL